MLEGLLPCVPTGPPFDQAQIIYIVISLSVQSQQTPGILDNYKTLFADWNKEIFFVWQSLKKLCWRSATSIKRILGLPIIFYTDICEHMCLWFFSHWGLTNASKCSNMQLLPSGLKIWITVSGWNAWPSSPTTRSSKGSSATIWKCPKIAIEIVFWRAILNCHSNIAFQNSTFKCDHGD